MENQYSVVPYHDPTSDDNLITEEILKFMDEDPSLGFDQFPEFPEPSSCAVGVDGGVLLDPDDPLSDPLIWDMLHDSTGNEDVAGPSGIHGERSDHGNCDIPQRQSRDFGNPIQLSVWPVPPSPYTCSGCHILREIIHTNGVHITNLEIHGRLGIISHAILDAYDFGFSNQSNHVYQMYDFCKESIISAKNFIHQYCEFRKAEGYTMLQDPLSVFYEAICVGIDEIESQNAFSQSTPMISGNDMIPRQEDIASQQNAENDGSRHTMDDYRENGGPQGESRRERAKSSLATQRERTGMMKLKDFSVCFHLPISEAAKQMRVCPTVIKKKCREAGLPRWPYRKIKGIKRKISEKQRSLSSSNVEERARGLAEIQMLETELAHSSTTNRPWLPRSLMDICII